MLWMLVDCRKKCLVLQMDMKDSVYTRLPRARMTFRRLIEEDLLEDVKVKEEREYWMRGSECHHARYSALRLERSGICYCTIGQ